mmetsp:Transcript_56277/g.89337  ORF Transcript_56277/g.89337 Transcript_56277/m.89337 type:complete len:167 (-) Transcript_56277:274-774(-)|eukprot:CAMPEP_0169116680 /NCGR_PEP_ID=MMETSP1015-20121227/30028_1 /TAXON_ID=342587 /ORGANISM="Karlodinium micrum, Strain CCMP2283" /LENGTH=166 /DNA_ID=CAMNT_0009179261 /DNA_START=52 /DNA_END=552 /DNA_ORIENTATION=+
MCLGSKPANDYVKVYKRVTFAEYVDEIRFCDEGIEIVVRPMQPPPTPFKLLGSSQAKLSPAAVARTSVLPSQARTNNYKDERYQISMKDLVFARTQSSNVLEQVPKKSLRTLASAQIPTCTIGKVNRDVVFCIECGCQMQTSFKFCSSCGQSMQTACKLRMAACAA